MTEAEVLHEFPFLERSGVTALSGVEYQDSGKKVFFHFNPETGRLWDVGLWSGFAAKMVFASRDDSPFGKHTYVLALGKAAERDGVPWTANLHDLGKGGPLTEIASAMLATYANAEASLDVDCSTGKQCWGYDYSYMGSIGGKIAKLRININFESSAEHIQLSDLHMGVGVEDSH